MKKAKRILFVLFTMLLVCYVPVSAHAMSAANKKAHRAFLTQIRKDKKQYRSTFIGEKLKYTYLDVDGDKVDELITVPGYANFYQAIYNYKNGKVSYVAGVGQGSFTKYYPKHKVIYINKSGHMGTLCDYYLKYTRGSYERVANVQYDYGPREYTEKPLCTTYFIKNKKVSRKQYVTYVRRLVKGEKGKSFKTLKWKKY